MSRRAATTAAPRPKPARLAPAGTGGEVVAGWLGMPTVREVLKEPEGIEEGLTGRTGVPVVGGFAVVKGPEGAEDGTVGVAVGFTGLTKVVVPGLTGLLEVVVPGSIGYPVVVLPGWIGFPVVVVPGWIGLPVVVVPGLTGSVVVETAKVSVMQVVVRDCSGQPGLPGGHRVRVRVLVV